MGRCARLLAKLPNSEARMRVATWLVAAAGDIQHKAPKPDPRQPDLPHTAKPGRNGTDAADLLE